jgi:hypothetical protein
MALKRTAGICCCIVFTSAVAHGQQQNDTSGVASAAQRTTMVPLPGINEAPREPVRTEYSERQISPGVTRHQGTQLTRDINGRWRPVEIRQGEVRQTGSERVEEETIQRPDLNGNLVLEEVNVIRSSSTKEQEQVQIETYAPQIDVHAVNGRPPLSTRIRRTTTTTADGGSYTVEEVEARNPASLNDPMRVIRRTVTSVSPRGRDAWVSEQQTFELDLNGRLRLVGE